ncbi:hypothetical protein AUJ77_01725 [Candidatus Nomurabacteria bacterium CG1_02_43_90]|uniref:HTH HARE-type domain-containing protein n=1 Tax=Candidatus Nomurabacteria bacterium CG1_02_43_90 TaxID=1805281 RepID=A0A1J4V8F7_9BACT|nr:MAG: hypothetical protein AUJ77_01725 [Candidatus Nomurabacteria bacterium CG1_02_43_90]
MSKSKKIIEQIESLLEELKEEVGIPIGVVKESKKVVAEKNFSGLTREIFNLVTEGFFDTAKSLSEIQKKLKEEGINKPTTALMKPVLMLIRKKVLGRNKPEKGQYQYYKRSK